MQELVSYKQTTNVIIQIGYHYKKPIVWKLQNTETNEIEGM